MNSTVRWMNAVTGRKRGYVVTLALLQVLNGSIGVVFAVFLRNIVDSAVSRDSQQFWRNVTLIMLVVLADLGIGALLRWLNEQARSDIENTLKKRLLDHILRRDYASVSATHTAEWLNRMTSDTTVVANGIVEILPGLVGTMVRLVSALVMIIALDRWFACVLIPGGILMVLLTYVFRKVLKCLHKNIQESDGLLRIFLQERISNLMIIKSFAAERQTSEAGAEKMANHKEARMKRNRFSNVANIGFSGAMEGMYVAGIIYCASGILSGTVTYGTLTAVMQLIGQIQAPFANISGYLPRWYATTASAERLMEIEAYAKDPAVYSSEEMRRYYQSQFACLRLENVSFAYSRENREKVLNCIDLQINKGQYIAITGRSGCGKSTLLKLLLCMYPIDSGERLIDGQPLTAAWRRLFAYVPQGNALMAGTIREVVSFADPQAAHDEERLYRALRIACADEFVNNIDAILGERGAGFSEGQIQRLAIARAIFSGAPILLLDEATSALDERTELKLLHNLRAMTDCTVIIVTHRKAVMEICDTEVTIQEDSVRYTIIDRTETEG